MTTPDVPMYDYLDSFGNVCTRLTIPGGGITISCGFAIADPFLPDEVVRDARQQPIEEMPDEVMLYLLGSRYCETELLSETAWANFVGLSGWALVRAIVTYADERKATARSARTEMPALSPTSSCCPHGGVAAQFVTFVPSPVYASRFTQISGVSASDSQARYQSLKNGSLLDTSDFQLAPSDETVLVRLLPASTSGYNRDIVDFLRVAYAEHQFSTAASARVRSLFAAV